MIKVLVGCAWLRDVGSYFGAAFAFSSLDLWELLVVLATYFRCFAIVVGTLFAGLFSPTVPSSVWFSCYAAVGFYFDDNLVLPSAAVLQSSMWALYWDAAVGVYILMLLILQSSNVQGIMCAG